MKIPKRSAWALVLVVLAARAGAGDVPLVGPPAEWVEPAPEFDPSTLSDTEGSVPLFDTQYFVDGDTVVSYIDAAQRVSNAEQLQRLGTLKMGWRPAHGDITFHRIEILRGAERIDLLKGEAGFTVLRREAGLENQVLDGSLTVIRQIEGLRLGDVVRVSVSSSESDEVLRGNAQAAMVLMPRPVRIGFGRARLVWPASQTIRWKSLMPGIATEPKAIAGNRQEITIPFPVAELPELPKDIPPRFSAVPLVWVSTFADWDEVASIMAPLYEVRGSIAEGSELARVTDEIAAKHVDPVARMAEALRIVQSDVRYLLVALGSGNYEPQPPSLTWEKRFGDCKAKTLLLLAMLDRLGVEAQPVLANTSMGDRIPELLPSASAFDHVLVRARIGEEQYWLDGTGIGTRLADIGNVPRFGHVLPIGGDGAKLEKLPLRPDARPSPDVDLTYDLTAGLHLPAPFVLTIRYTGGNAETMRQAMSQANSDKVMETAEGISEKWTGSTTILKPVTSYDPDDATFSIRLEGLAYPEWEYLDGKLQLEAAPTIGVGFEADRTASAWRNIPALIASPWTAHAKVTRLLPDQAKTATIEGVEPLTLDLPSIAYARTISRTGTVIVEEVTSRESGEEIAPEEISATRRKIGAVNATLLRIVTAGDYPYRWEEVERVRNSPGLERIRAVFDRRIAEKPKDASRLSDRAWLEERLLNWAAADRLYGKAIALDPSASLYLSRSGVRSTMGDMAGGLADAQSAHDLDPGDADVRSTLAYALAQSGRVDEAIDLFDPSPDIASEEGRSEFLSRVYTLMLGGRGAESLELLDTALRKRATEAELLNYRCYTKALSNTDLENALADCTRAIELAADPAAYFDSRAMVHFRAGKLDLALADLDDAISLSPERAPSRFMRGLIAARQSGGKSGTADITAARRLDPSIDAYFARFGIRP